MEVVSGGTQWGNEKQVGAARFIPHVSDNRVNGVIMVDNGGDAEAAAAAMLELERACVGLDYEMWEFMLSNPAWKPQQ